MNVKGERVSLPVVPVSYRNLSGDAERLMWVLTNFCWLAKEGR
jgi:hypothetical protein